MWPLGGDPGHGGPETDAGGLGSISVASETLTEGPKEQGARMGAKAGAAPGQS